MVANADKKLGKYGGTDLWGRSEISASAIGTPPSPLSDSKMLKSATFSEECAMGTPPSRRATKTIILK